MIDNMKEYDAMLMRLGNDFPNKEAHSDMGKLHDTFLALRNVARAAQHFAAPGYERPQYEWRTPVIEALDALPAWCLEEEA